VPAANTAAKSDHELEFLKRRRERVHQGIGRRATPVDDGSSADLEHMSEWQHANDRRFGRGHDLLVEEAFAHQHRLDVMTAVSGNLVMRRIQ
jgi:hypothetical protein